MTGAVRPYGGVGAGHTVSEGLGERGKERGGRERQRQRDKDRETERLIDGSLLLKDEEFSAGD